MRNAMILLGLWIGIIIAAYSIVYVNNEGPTPVEVSSLERVAARTYADPSGRFELVVPIGWRTEEEGGILHLTDPLEEVEGWVVCLDDLAAVRAIETAWEAVDPCFEREFGYFEELIPAPPEIRRVGVVYTAEEGILSYGVAHVVLEGTVVLLVRGDLAACQGRGADDLRSLGESLTVRWE